MNKEKRTALRYLVDATTRIALSMETMLAVAREERRKEVPHRGASWTVLVELKSGALYAASGRGPGETSILFDNRFGRVGYRCIAWEREALAEYGGQVAAPLDMTLNPHAFAAPDRPPLSEEKLAEVVATLKARRPAWDDIESIEVHGAVTVVACHIHGGADFLGAPLPAFLVSRIIRERLAVEPQRAPPGYALRVEIQEDR